MLKYIVKLGKVFWDSISIIKINTFQSNKTLDGIMMGSNYFWTIWTDLFFFVIKIVLRMYFPLIWFQVTVFHIYFLYRVILFYYLDNIICTRSRWTYYIILGYKLKGK